MALSFKYMSHRVQQTSVGQLVGQSVGQSISLFVSGLVSQLVRASIGWLLVSRLDKKQIYPWPFFYVLEYTNIS